MCLLKLNLQSSLHLTPIHQSILHPSFPAVTEMIRDKRWEKLSYFNPKFLLHLSSIQPSTLHPTFSSHLTEKKQNQIQGKKIMYPQSLLQSSLPSSVSSLTPSSLLLPHCFPRQTTRAWRPGSRKWSFVRTDMNTLTWIQRNRRDETNRNLYRSRTERPHRCTKRSWLRTRRCLMGLISPVRNWAVGESRTQIKNKLINR